MIKRRYDIKNVFFVVLPLVVLFAVFFSVFPAYAITPPGSSDRGDGTYHNPVIWADVPDVDIVKVGDTYWMASTTMHMAPGVPVMKSKDLVNWETVSYAYNVLGDTDAMKLQKGGNMYSHGSWASTFRYKDGTFYIITPSPTPNKAIVFQTEDPENQPWRRYELPARYHDSGLLMDDDGKNWLLHGTSILELNSTVTGLASGAQDRRVLNTLHAPNPDNNNITPTSGLAEGVHIRKISAEDNGMGQDMYYIFAITSDDNTGWMRQQVAHRAPSLDTPPEEWESKVVARESINGSGVAQGDIIKDSAGNWQGLLFRDSGAGGRLPWLMPITWTDGWPMHGKDGSYKDIPRTADIPVKTDEGIKSVVTSDEFYNNAPKPTYYDSNLVSLPADVLELPEEVDLPAEYRYNGSNLNLAWQWNHNPDNRYWSLTERPGWLRLRTGYKSTNILDAPNTLSQRTFGPQSSAVISIDVSNMKDGDEAGLSLFTAKYGSIGIKMEGDEKYIVTTLSNSWSGGHTTNAGVEVARIPLTGDKVFLKADAHLTNDSSTYSTVDRGYFYYSLDGKTWTRLMGESPNDRLNMSYGTNNHFMGYRFALYNFAKTEVGGYVDFDYFRLDDKLMGETEPTILGASMTNQTDVPCAAGTVVSVPVQLDPLPGTSYSEIAASFEIPAGIEVTDVTFGTAVTGEKSWNVKDNQLELEVKGKDVGYAPAARSQFASITLKLNQQMPVDTVQSIVPDYVIAKGGNVIYNLDSVKADMTFVTDKAKLNEKIMEVKSMNSSSYTSASWAALQTVLKEVEATLGNADATQEQVDTAIENLTNAIKALMPIQSVNKETLNAKIAEVQSKSSSAYTSASWAALQTVLKAAKAVLDNPGATQVQVDTAVTALANAVKALVPVSAVPHKNSTHKVGALIYKVIKSQEKNGTVKVIGMSNTANTKITVFDTVKINGYTFKVTEIGNNAFKNSKNLRKVTIKNTLTKIGARAFANCKKLKSITIGKGLKTIGKEAFSKNALLLNIKINSSKVGKVDKNAFKGIAKKAKIKVPKKQVKSYKRIFRKDGRPKTVKIS